MKSNIVEGNKRNRAKALDVAYKPDEKYRGIVYVAVSSGEQDIWKEYHCYIDELPDMLIRLNIDAISSSKTKKNVYITNNSFKTFKGRVENEEVGKKQDYFH